MLYRFKDTVLAPMMADMKAARQADARTPGHKAGSVGENEAAFLEAHPEAKGMAAAGTGSMPGRLAR